jgi:tetratricopeptide (TPR) repeat protein
MGIRRTLLCMITIGMGAAHEPNAASAQSPELQVNYNMFKAYHAQGLYAEGEPYLKHALRLGEKEYGLNHYLTGQLLESLAEVYRLQGRYAEAEPLFQRSLAIHEQAFGPEHSHVARCLNNLAVLYVAEERYAKAEPLLQRALDIFEKTSEPRDPQLAMAPQ